MLISEQSWGICARAVCVLFVLFFVSCNPLAARQTTGPEQFVTDDPQQLALDLYGQIRRAAPPDAVALRLTAFIRLYRYDCVRVSDYQVFLNQQTMIDVKVKCSGAPLYGVTIASNGYGAVYGGNEMLRSLNRRDGLIYSFGADGTLADTSRRTLAEALSETSTIMDQRGTGKALTLFLSVSLIGIAGGVLIAFSVKAVRKGLKRRKTRRCSPPDRLKPLNTITSADKDLLMEQSTPVSRKLYQHPSGLFVAIGPRGKRRIFERRLWAILYCRMGWKLFERITLTNTAHDDRSAV